jgi:hypothetical protein
MASSSMIAVNVNAMLFITNKPLAIDYLPAPE